MKTSAGWWRLGWMLLLLGWAGFRLAQAGEVSAEFDRANQLYEQGKYSQAIEVYNRLVDEGELSAPLYFNLANAYFKNGQTGQAIVYYRLAERLAPRDPDIRANLRFARETVGAKAPSARRWQQWLGVLTLNELTLLAVVVCWLWLLVLAVSQFRRAWMQALRPYRVGLGLAAVLSLVWLGIILAGRLGTSSAVVIARQAPVRYGPFDEAQPFYTAREGTELAVLGRKDSWFQVSDSSDRTGWLRVKDVMVLPRG